MTKLHFVLALASQTVLINTATPYATITESATERALRTAAEEVSIPPRFLRAVCMVESNLDPQAYNGQDGHGGSYGLCQIKFITAVRFGYQGPAMGLLNPEVNAILAARYLKHQLLRYHGNWVRAIAAYNAGSAGREIKNMDYVERVIKQISGGGL